jgi:ParB/RepB/Spo0J family partition protein
MAQQADAPLEIGAQELGQRLAQVRLVSASDVAMEASLRRYGQLSPLVAFRDDADRLEVIDGFRRLRAANHQGHPARLSVRVLALDEPRALAALFTLHRGDKGLTELEQAWVVRALVREHGMQQQQVAQLLRRDQSWVSRRLLLVEALSPEVQMDVRLGLCSPTAAREVARLPRGIQQVVARLIARNGLSTRQAARFVAATEQLTPATAEQIERLCHSAQTQLSPIGPQSDVVAYVADLGVLERIATRLRARLCECPPAKLPAPGAEEVRGFLRAALPIVRLLCLAMTKTLEQP